MTTDVELTWIEMPATDRRAVQVRPATRNGADTLLDGPLAHPVEQGTFNPKVARSRLARPTCKCIDSADLGPIGIG